MSSKLVLAVVTAAGLGGSVRAQDVPSRGDPFQPVETALDRIVEVEKQVIPQSALLKGTGKRPQAELGMRLDVTGPGLRGCTEDQMLELTALWWRMRADLKTLRAASKAEDHAVPPAYREALRSAESLLAQVIDPKTEPARRTVLCAAVASDLRVKAAYAAANRNEAFKPVRVTARTCKGPVEKPGCFVVCVADGYAHLPNPPEFLRKTELVPPTNKASTTQEVPPGLYVMWARLPGVQGAGPRRKLEVGLDGKKDLEVDLEAP